MQAISNRFKLIKLPTGILVDITDYIDPWDFARMDHALRKSPEWNANILPNVKFNFWIEHLPSYVLSWCIRRNIKITGLIADSSWNFACNGGSKIDLLTEFLQYTGRGGLNSMIELGVYDQPSDFFPNLVGALLDARLSLPALKTLHVGGGCFSDGFIYPTLRPVHLIANIIRLILRCCPQLQELRVRGLVETHKLLHSLKRMPSTYPSFLPWLH